MKLVKGLLYLLLVLLAAVAFSQTPINTAFTYQGLLKNAGGPAVGLHDMRFRLYDAASDGVQVGSTVCNDNIIVAEGRFTVLLDFGAQFAGEQRWLEIEVRPDTGMNCGNLAGFVLLAPRQPLSATPYAVFALNAGAAANATQLEGQAASFYQDATNISSGTLATARLPVPLTLSGTNATHIIQGENASSALSAAGVLGTATATIGTTYGGLFRSNSSAGRGVFGLAIDDTGTTYGGFFQSLSAAGRGVFGWASSDVGTTYGGRFESGSTSGRGVYGLAYATSGNTYGGFFQSDSPGGIGVSALATATSGSSYAGYFRNDSVSGRAVFGQAIATSGNTYGGFFTNASPGGIGVSGLATATTGPTYAGYFRSDSVSGLAVFGQATATSGTTNGGRFESGSTSGQGVFGLAYATSGTTNGGYFQSDSFSGRGVYGLATSIFGGTGGRFESAGATGRGVVGLATNTADDGNPFNSSYGGYFESAAPDGSAVRGWATADSGSTRGGSFTSSSPDGVGVYSQADAGSGAIYGVLGSVFSDSVSAYAVWAHGRLGASGTKSFRIDHPDDPENKYLVHYSAESPEVINFYRGTVTLDAAGAAIVELPRYFASINASPSYQLTAVGSPMPMLHIAEEIDPEALTAGNKAGPGASALLCWFRIAGGAAGGKVSWRVEALRNDRWVQKRGVPVEVVKQGREKGKYQHPDLYGQPEEKGMHYNPTRHHPEPVPALD